MNFIFLIFIFTPAIGIIIRLPTNIMIGHSLALTPHQQYRLGNFIIVTAVQINRSIFTYYFYECGD